MYTVIFFLSRFSSEMRNLSLVPATRHFCKFDKFYVCFLFFENRRTECLVSPSSKYHFVIFNSETFDWQAAISNLEIAKQPREILRFSSFARKAWKGSTETNLMNRKRKMIQRNRFSFHFSSHAFKWNYNCVKKKISLTIIYLLRKNQFMRVVIKIIIQWLHLIHVMRKQKKKKKYETTQISKNM